MADQHFPDVPFARPKPPAPANPLSESEEDAVEDNGLAVPGGSGSGDPVAAAVLKLTKIASHLSRQRNANTSNWETLLDGSGGAGSTDSHTSSSRRHAAALRLLRKSLASNPKSIFETIENNMADDFQSVRQMPGSTAVQVSSRAWLELRSRVQNYATPVRLLWGIAGAHDALRRGATEECRARLALLLCQGDQLSIDRGSWVVASELGLEDPPPMTSFLQHRLPSEAEPPYSKLIDPRWMELVLHRLNEFDQLSEKKKKLQKKPPNPGGREEDAAKDGKGKGKKGKKTSQEETATA